MIRGADPLVILADLDNRSSSSVVHAPIDGVVRRIAVNVVNILARADVVYVNWFTHGPVMTAEEPVGLLKQVPDTSRVRRHLFHEGPQLFA